MRMQGFAPFSRLIVLSLGICWLSAVNPIAAQMASPPKSKAPGSLVLGQPRSVQVAQAYGSVIDTLPIIVPPGRHGVEPHLALTYNSGVADGIMGLGWDFQLGYIEIDGRNGLPASGNPDQYSFYYAGLGGELIGNSAGVYHSRTETVYREFRKLTGGGWEMRDGQGNAYLFGSSSNSRLCLPGTTTCTLWLLDTIRDPAGNTITVNYFESLGALYPLTIDYTGGNGMQPANQIVFEYVERPDTRQTYRHGVSETKILLLSSIEADVIAPSRQMARKYEFFYAQSDTYQSILQSIQLVGDDGTSVIPLRRMLYTDQTEGWGGGTQTKIPLVGKGIDFVELNGSDGGSRLVDLDGDGCADVINTRDVSGFNSTTISYPTVHLGDCSGSFQNRETQSAAWTQSLANANIPKTVGFPVTVDSQGDTVDPDQGVQFVDVNADGRPDIVFSNTSFSRSEVWLNQYPSGGPGWAKANWALPTSESNYDPVDGHTNCGSGMTTGQYPFQFSLVYLGTDSNGNKVPAAPTGVSFVDVNGDGLPDIVWSLYQAGGDADGNDVCIAAVYLNSGSGWVRNNALSHQLSLLSRQGMFFLYDTTPTGWQAVDINGDGMADLLYSGGHAGSSVMLFNGAQWVTDTDYTNSLEATHLWMTMVDGSPTGLQFMDFNHDGLPDLFYHDATGNISPGGPKAYRNTGTGFTEDAVMEAQLASLPFITGPIDNDTHAQLLQLADINGDGFVDMLQVSPGDTEDETLAAVDYFWLGGYCAPTAPGCAAYNSSPHGHSTPIYVPAGMMTLSESPFGEMTNIVYNRAPNSFQLPQFVPVQLTRHDVRQDSGVTTPGLEAFNYTYYGGTYTNREFLGFSEVDVLDSDSNVTKTWFDNSEMFMGQEDQVSLYDNSGYLRYNKTNTWTTMTRPGEPNGLQGALRSITESFYDTLQTNANPNYTSVKRITYDNDLNPLQVYENPDTSVPSLDHLTSYNWAYSPNGYVWSLPTSITTYWGLTTNVLSYQRMNYDRQPNGQATAGILTSEQQAIQLVPSAQFVTQTTGYDQYGNVASILDRNGKTTSFQYDPSTASQRVSATDPNGNTVHSTYDPRFGAVLTDTDPSGNVTSYQYDAFGRLAEVIKPGDAGQPGGTTSFTYSLLTPYFSTGFNVTRTDNTSNGKSITTQDYYDAYGQIYQTVRQGNAGPVIVNTTYDSQEMPVSVSRPYYQGSTPVYTTITRDALHRITRIQDPNGAVTTRSYAGTQVAETDPRGQTTVTLYDPSQRVLAKTLPIPGGAATTTYTYDGIGQLLAVQRADGSQTNITYDLLGRKTSMTDPNTGNFSYQYDSQGHMTSVVSPDGKTIQYTYSPTGELQSRIYPDGTMATVTYGNTAQANAAGRVVKVTDPAGSVQFAYDTRGRIVQKSRWVAVKNRTYVTKYSFDSADELTSLTYPDGFQVNYGYDNAGDITSVTESSGKLIAGNFTYTASGRLTGLQYGNGVRSTYSYDATDRMVRLATATSGGHQVQGLVYTYDPNSNITSIADSVYGANQHFAYDSVNRLIQAQGPGYGTEAYTYDAIGNLLTRGSLAYGMDKQHPERADCILVNIRGANSCATNPLDQINIFYDLRGNVSQLGTARYSYDQENHLTVESNNGGVVEKNIYDFWGERVVQQTAGETRVFIDDIYEEGASEISHHVKTPNLLLATVVTAIRLAKPLSKQGTRIYSAPIDTVRASPSATASSAPFLYSSIGFSVGILFLGGAVRVRRRGKRWSVQLRHPVLRKPFRSLLVILLTFSFVTSAAYEGWAQAPRQANDTGQEGLRTTVTLINPGVPSTGEKHFYYHMNHLGGVNVVTDDAAEVVAVRQYKPYGEMYQNQGSVAATTAPFAFDGERMDGAGNLYDFHARFYSPLLCRFLSADSEIHNPASPLALNRYAFAGGNPIRYVDPSGHSWFDFLIGAVIFVSIIAICLLSGGAGLALFALAAGVVGLGIGMGVAAGLGYKPGSADFWQIALTGALIGAGIGAGVGAVALEGAGAAAATAEAAEAADEAGIADEADASGSTASSAGNSRNIGFSMLKSIMFGGPQSVMVNELQGGGTDHLLLATEEGIGASALTGGLTGIGSSSVQPSLALSAWGEKLGDMILMQGALWTFAGFTHQGAGGFAIGLGRDVVSPQNSPRVNLTNRWPQTFNTQSVLPPIQDPTPY